MNITVPVTVVIYWFTLFIISFCLFLLGVTIYNLLKERKSKTSPHDYNEDDDYNSC